MDGDGDDKPVRVRTSQRLNPEEFRRIDHEYGPIVLDANGNRINPLVPQFCDNSFPFTDVNTVKNQTVWLEAESSPDIAAQIRHFEVLRQKDPMNTRALILLPDIPKSGLSSSNDTNNLVHNILKKYTKVHTYPAGTYLYDNADTGKPKPTECSYSLYLADDSVEDKCTTAQLTAAVTIGMKLQGLFGDKARQKLI